MNDNDHRAFGSAVAPPERCQVFEATVELTEDQKAWPKVKIVPSGIEGVGLLVPVEKRVPPQEVLPAVAEMLTTGRATDAEAVFARIRAAGLTLRAVVGEDGVLRVTVGA